MGRIQGKHLGLKNLKAWAKDTLHSSLTLFSLKANNIFEVTFEQEEGRLHALKLADLTCESATIFFSSWRPHFNPRTPKARDTLDYPVWVQIVNLCQILREEAFLRTIGEQLGQVISINNSDAYRAKLFGPRIRLLVQDINNLPQPIVLPRLDGGGEIKYQLEFSGLPNQCGRCRSRDHQVKHCPKRDTQVRRREPRKRARTGRGGRDTKPAHSGKESPPCSSPDASPPKVVNVSETIARGSEEDASETRPRGATEGSPTERQDKNAIPPPTDEPGTQEPVLSPRTGQENEETTALSPLVDNTFPTHPFTARRLLCAD